MAPMYSRAGRPRGTSRPPFEVLRTSDEVWSALHDVVGRIMPGVPHLLDYLADGAPNLAVALPRLPDVTSEIEQELLDAIQAT